MAEVTSSGVPLMGAVNKIKDSAMHVFAQRKPMSEILDRTAYQRPGSFSEATGRIQKNLNYFKINYFLGSALVFAFFIITNPSSLFVLALIAASWTYVYLVRTEPLKIGERPVSDREKMLGMSGASILAIFFMSSAGSVMLQAFGVATAAVAAHGAMRVPDDLFIDDANTDGGFFSFLQPPRAGITGSVA
jgi:hypothetical protein